MNGYELRLEMLRMAKDLMLDFFHSEKEKLNTEYYAFIETNKNNPEKMLEKELVFPHFPTIVEIVKQADIFNEFVVKK